MSYADRDKYGMYKDIDSAGPGPSLMGADTLLGERVVNTYEVELGDIKEIMLDMQSGQVAYAVLSFGGFLGVGEKLFAVPWQALRLDTVQKRFILDVDKDRLKTAPGFDKDAWPNMADMQWANQIHSFYGTDPARAGARGLNPSAGAGSTAAVPAAGTGVGAVEPGTGSGDNLDPRAGNQGGTDDVSRIRGSNIG